VCGGGVLTLPIAFARVGILPSTVMMIISAIITDFSMYILCSCARRTGGRSYGDVTRTAFGLKAEIAVTVLLFVFLVFVIIAYMVLVKDIWTPLILYFSPWLKNWCLEEWDVDPDQSALPSNVFLVVFTFCSLPLLLQRNLHALRHTCYVGFASLVLLIVAIVRRAYHLNFITDVDMFETKVKWYSNDINDYIYAFPIISLSLFSIYNVLTVHSALINPTRQRVKFVLDGTILICLVLFYIVGLSGYLYAYDKTKDNILLNFPLNCKMVTIGRLGYGFTLMFGLPLVFLPCRDALLSLPVLIQKWMKDGDTKDMHQLQPQTQATSLPLKMPRMSGLTKEGHVVVNGIDFDEERPLLKRNSSIIPMNKAVMMGNIIPMRQLVGGVPSYQQLSDYGSTYTKTNSTNSGTDTDTDISIMDADMDVVHGAGSLESGLSMDDEYYDHDGGRENLQKHISTNSILTDNSWKECELKHNKNTNVAKNKGSHKFKRDQKKILKDEDKNLNCKGGSIDIKSESEVTSAIPTPPNKTCQSQEEMGGDKTEISSLVHVISTVCILIFGYICAVAVPGVGFVWSICGSSMALIIGFFVPSACYLKIRSKKNLNPRSLGAWTILIFSVFASVVCTYHILMGNN